MHIYIIYIYVYINICQSNLRDGQVPEKSPIRSAGPHDTRMTGYVCVCFIMDNLYKEKAEMATKGKYRKTFTLLVSPRTRNLRSATRPFRVSVLVVFG